MSVNIEVTVEQGLTLALQELIEQYPEAVGAALMRIAERVLNTSNTLVPVRTGFLKSQWAFGKITIFKLHFLLMRLTRDMLSLALGVWLPDCL